MNAETRHGQAREPVAANHAHMSNKALTCVLLIMRLLLRQSCDGGSEAVTGKPTVGGLRVSPLSFATIDASTAAAAGLSDHDLVTLQGGRAW